MEIRSRIRKRTNISDLGHTVLASYTTLDDTIQLNLELPKLYGRITINNISYGYVKDITIGNYYVLDRVLDVALSGGETVEVESVNEPININELATVDYVDQIYRDITYFDDLDEHLVEPSTPNGDYLAIFDGQTKHYKKINIDLVRWSSNDLKDLIGSILTDTTSIDFNYDVGLKTISAEVDILSNTEKLSLDSNDVFLLQQASGELRKVTRDNLLAPVLGSVQYRGTWNANTNTPSLSSGVGNKGDYYVVNIAGTTNLDGITDWQIGDWVIFNGTAWEKIDNTDQVTSVNGQQGVVVLDTDDITEGATNLYYTDTRVRSAISGSNGLTYNGGTGLFKFGGNLIEDTNLGLSTFQFTVTDSKVTKTGVRYLGFGETDLNDSTGVNYKDHLAFNSLVPRLFLEDSIGLQNPVELTIAAGVITRTQVNHTIDTEADAISDDLETINGGVIGQRIIIRADNATRDIVIKHGVGNIFLNGESDFTLDDATKQLELVYNGTNWTDIGIGAGGSLLTQGSIGFAGADGKITEDNANFFAEATSGQFRVGLGGNTPASDTRLDIWGASDASTTQNIRLRNNSGATVWTFSSNGNATMFGQGIFILGDTTVPAGGSRFQNVGSGGTAWGQVSYRNSVSGNSTVIGSENITGGHGGYFATYHNGLAKSRIQGTLDGMRLQVHNGVSYETSHEFTLLGERHFTQASQPIASIADGYIEYSADSGGAPGLASPHFRVEDGTIIDLYDVNARAQVLPSSFTINSIINSDASGNLTTSSWKIGETSTDMMEFNYEAAENGGQTANFYIKADGTKTNTFLVRSATLSAKIGLSTNGAISIDDGGGVVGSYLRLGGNNGTNAIPIQVISNAGKGISSQGSIVMGRQSGLLPTDFVGGVDANSQNAFYIRRNGTNVPTDSVIDGIIMYPDDSQGTPGLMSPHFRVEDGTVIDLLDVYTRANNIPTSLTNGQLLFGNSTGSVSQSDKIYIDPLAIAGSNVNGSITFGSSLADQTSSAYRVLIGYRNTNMKLNDVVVGYDNDSLGAQGTQSMVFGSLNAWTIAAGAGPKIVGDSNTIGSGAGIYYGSSNIASGGKDIYGNSIASDFTGNDAGNRYLLGRNFTQVIGGNSGIYERYSITMGMENPDFQIRGINSVEGYGRQFFFGTNASHSGVDQAANNALVIPNGTAPTSNILDGIYFYSADSGGTPGLAAPHFRAEDGTIIDLYALNAASAAIPTGFTQGSIAFADGSGNLTEDNANLKFNNTTDTLITKHISIGNVDAVNAGLYIRKNLINAGIPAIHVEGSGINEDFFEVNHENKYVLMSGGGTNSDKRGVFVDGVYAGGAGKTDHSSFNIITRTTTSNGTSLILQQGYSANQSRARLSHYTIHASNSYLDRSLTIGIGEKGSGNFVANKLISYIPQTTSIPDPSQNVFNWHYAVATEENLDDTSRLMALDGNGVLAIFNAFALNATIPSSSVTDGFQMYSEDFAGAGTASPVFRCEDDTIIKLRNLSTTQTKLVLTETDDEELLVPFYGQVSFASTITNAFKYDLDQIDSLGVPKVRVPGDANGIVTPNTWNDFIAWASGATSLDGTNSNASGTLTPPTSTTYWEMFTGTVTFDTNVTTGQRIGMVLLWTQI